MTSAPAPSTLPNGSVPPSGAEPRNADGSSSNPAPNGSVTTTPGNGITGTSSVNPPSWWTFLFGPTFGNDVNGTLKRLGIGAAGVLLIVIGVLFYMEADLSGAFKSAAKIAAANPELAA